MTIKKTDIIARASEPWVDSEKGTVDRSIYSDPEIYRRELKNIFARAWNFMCHESQLPEIGSYFMNYIGEDEVIVVRDQNNEVRVLLNSCPHRGNSVCRAEQGKTRRFLCTYHGWNFELDGGLIGMPGISEYYRNDIDKEQWGLARAAKVESYKGFVFATMDPEAPSLDEYLGWVGRLGIDLMASRGELEVVDGIQKNRLQCNWKLAVDNVYDWYHPKISHGSALRAGFLEEFHLYPKQQMVMLGNFGHGIGGPYLNDEQMAQITEAYGGDDAPKPRSWEEYQVAHKGKDEVQQLLGPVGSRALGHPHVFPNFWISTVHSQICLRIPRGPQETELWWFTLVHKDATPEARKAIIDFGGHMFGPAGLLEQDDGENWSHSTRGSVGEISGRRPLNFAMGRGHDQVLPDPSGQSRIETVVNEHAQLWTYRSWQAWMQAENWQELMEIHPQPPEEGSI